MCAFDNKPIETLRMDDREKRRVIDAYIAKNSNTGGAPRDIRVQCEEGGTATVAIANPGGNRVSYTVIPRNLSRWGMGFLHGRFVYQDSECAVSLKTLDGEVVTAQGKVVRCLHLGSTIHEVGVLFHTPIDLSLFVTLSAEEAAAQIEEHERDLLSGKIASDEASESVVLIVDESNADRRLCEMHLSQAGYTCQGVRGDVEALDRAQAGGFELAVVDICLDPSYGLDLVSKLVGCPGGGAVLAISADHDDATRNAALDAGASEFLAKPIKPEELTELARQFAMSSGGGSSTDAIISSLSHETAMQPIIREFVGEAGRLATNLQKALANNDQDAVRLTCRKLKGSGTGYGYEVVTEMAGGVMAALEETDNDLAECKTHVDKLLDVLRRIRPS